MASMCENILFVDIDNKFAASKQNISDFTSFLNNMHPFDGFFQTLKPPPENLMRKYSAYYLKYTKEMHKSEKHALKNMPNYLKIVHNWNKENWGIITDIDRHDIHMLKSAVPLTMNFETQWTPPVKGIQLLSKKFSHVIFTLEYYQIDDNICGLTKFKNGKAISQKERFPCDDKEILNDFGFEPRE